MVFLATGPVPEIPNKDICSWIFDEPKYDVNKPVSNCRGPAGQERN
jgi:hypothetical protein